jgi:hypothetical protein
MARHRRVTLGTLALVAYDMFVRPWMLDWGSAPGQRDQPRPGDDIVELFMSHHTRAVTINALPEAVWPWLVQIGDHRAGFYSYDWIERFAFPRHRPLHRAPTPRPGSTPSCRTRTLAIASTPAPSGDSPSASRSPSPNSAPRHSRRVEQSPRTRSQPGPIMVTSGSLRSPRGGNDR